MMLRVLSRRWTTGARVLGVMAAVCGCSAGSSDGGSSMVPSDSDRAGSGGAAASTSFDPVPTAGTGALAIDPGPGTGGDAGGAASCATQQADAAIERQPVDIIVVIDNSGSMQDEIDAVEKSINVNFASVLQKSGVDYRVILLSRHEKAKRQTSICVTAPLSGNTACPPTPDQPAFTERFYQYSLKVDSLNSLVLLIGTYNGATPDEFKLGPMGWSAWLRPTAKKVFLEITDDNSDQMTAQEFERQLFALSPQNFGSANNRKYTFHSIVGIAEKAKVTDAWLPNEPVQAGECTGNKDTVENAGPVYQELSRLSGGLRFPLCQFNAYDTVFETIAHDVATHAAIACEFAIPPAPGEQTLDLSKVAVSYDPGDGTGAKTFGQAMNLEGCVPNAFYIDSATKKILLCPGTCDAVQAGKNPAIDVLFTCEPTYVPPPK